MRYTTTFYLLILMFMVSRASAQNLEWTHNYPITEEGKRLQEMVELYTKKQDYSNAYIVSKKGMQEESQSFYFYDRYVRNAYMTERSNEVVALSDKLISSKFSDDFTFVYNSWIHNYLGDWKAALRNLNAGLSALPNKDPLLKSAMRISFEHKEYDSFLQYAQAMLDINPNDAETFQYLYDYNIALGDLEQAIITGEINLFLNPSSRNNIKNKNSLIGLYNKWLTKEPETTAYSCFSQPVPTLNSINTLADLIKLQNHWVYNYEPDKVSSSLEKHLYDYKLEIIRNCNWVAYWYYLFGVSSFPSEYQEYLKKNQTELAGVQECAKGYKI